MKKLIVVLAVTLAGCGSLKEWMPVKWDVNQSRAVTDIQQSTRNFDCKADIAQQSKALVGQVQWLMIYSETKGTQDVISPAGHMNDTVKELADRSSKGPVSSTYCEIKKKIMVQQSDMLAHTVQGRLF